MATQTLEAATESLEGEVQASPGAIEQLVRGEVDVQIATARRYPRSVKQFIDQAMTLATLDEDTAASCLYALPRDGKTIEGPSARLAEICASTWGHMRAGARIVHEDERFVTALGQAWDIQNNVAVGFEVRRRITTSKGKRYSDDMVGVTGNAACSIALRNAVFKVVPSAFWRPIYLAARKVAVGTAQTLVKRREEMLAYFLKMGVVNQRVFDLIEVKGVEDITLEHMATLRGLATAIKDGETTVDQAFPLPQTQKPTDPGKTEPEGFSVFLETLKAAAAKGEDEFAGVWTGASEKHREHLTSTDAALFEALKNQAMAVKP